MSRRRVYLVALTAEQHAAAVQAIRHEGDTYDLGDRDGDRLHSIADAIEHAPTVTPAQVDGICRAVRNLGEQVLLDCRSDLRHVSRAAHNGWAALHRAMTR